MARVKDNKLNRLKYTYIFFTVFLALSSVNLEGKRPKNCLFGIADPGSFGRQFHSFTKFLSKA